MGRRRRKLTVGEPHEKTLEMLVHTDLFMDAYIECALATTNDESTVEGGEPIDETYSPQHLAPDALQKIMDDCRLFQERCAPMIRDAFHRKYQGAEGAAGHDFWLTRNGHGAGFWDGDWVEPVGDLLTDAAKAFGQQDLTIGGDGLVHVL